jgi:hypothetical protein
MIQATPPCPLTHVIAGRVWTRVGGEVRGKVGISTEEIARDETLNILSNQKMQRQNNQKLAM